MGLDVPIKKAVLDTGPLLSAITLELIRNRTLDQREAILRDSRLEPYLRDIHKHQVFLQFFESIEVVLTTSHVVAEIHGLRFLKGDLKKEFWECAITLLQRKAFSEELIGLFQLHSQELLKMVAEIGPTDVALTELAFVQGCVLLTEDERTLAPWAWNQGVDCRVVQHFL